MRYIVTVIRLKSDLTLYKRVKSLSDERLRRCGRSCGSCGRARADGAVRVRVREWRHRGIGYWTFLTFHPKEAKTTY